MSLRRALFALLATVAIGCGSSDPATPANDAGVGAADAGDGKGTTVFEGTYTIQSSQPNAVAFNAAVAEVLEKIEAKAWAEITPLVAPGSTVGDALAKLEPEFFVGSVAKTRAPSVLIAKGIDIGANAAGDAVKEKVAEELVEKSLFVLVEMLAFHELSEFYEEDGTAQSKADDVDHAALVLAGIESKFAAYATAQVSEIWGPGTKFITDDELVKKIGTLLLAAHDAIAKGAPDAATAVEEARLYVTKYFYASTLKYANAVATKTATGENVDGPMAEGGTLAEGVVGVLFGATDDAAAPVRALWSGAPTAVTVPAMRTAMIEVYAKIATNQAALVDGADASKASGAAGALAGVVDVTAEALKASGADPTALHGKALEVAAKVKAGDGAGAKTLATEIETAVAAAAK